MNRSQLSSAQPDAYISTVINGLCAEAGHILDVLLIGTTTDGLLDALAVEAERPGSLVRLTVFEPLADADRPRTQQAIRYITGIGPYDLRTNPEVANKLVSSMTLLNATALSEVLNAIESAADAQPLIGDFTFDAVIVDLALNQCLQDQVDRCLGEMFRVLKRGGKLVATAILADADDDIPTTTNGNDAVTHFPTEVSAGVTLERNGFYGVTYSLVGSPMRSERCRAEFRFAVLEAYKGKQGICLDQGHAVMLKGPWKEVWDDDGHRYVRGERTAVCEKTYKILMRAPYRDFFIGLPAAGAPALSDAPIFDCSTPRLRDPDVTRGVSSVQSESAAV
ncbi:methyltransferase domain-containing protein [Burkholderia gladioli]|uniref:methyltransferase domain-containing protein n=1 Tax=Burkholderia gladioli TaxID=28095 RepID=UPI001C5F3AFD|nr:methyltransferase domain-containing protein [Burkholderia gladioli]MBW5287217.1 methyltransferase domain-containing protein [Burkholderia gladioli]